MSDSVHGIHRSSTHSDIGDSFVHVEHMYQLGRLDNDQWRIEIKVADGRIEIPDLNEALAIAHQIINRVEMLREEHSLRIVRNAAMAIGAGS